MSMIPTTTTSENWNGSVSIVIPTYNRLDNLKRCIESIQNQGLDSFEIIVVNDASTDGTSEFLKTLEVSNLRIIEMECNQGVCSARNQGIHVASMPIIAFIDDDCVALENWLSHLISPFSDDSCGLVIGQTWYRKDNYIPHFPERVVHNRNAAWPMTCNMAYRKIVFEQIGGFSKEYSYYHNEDTEMAIRAVSAGWKYSRVLNAQVSHQESHWTINSLLTSAKNPCAAILLKRDYPNHHECFEKQLTANFFLRPEEYLVILLITSVLPLFLLACIGFGRKGLLYFTYWYIRFIVRRYQVYRTALICRLLVI